MDPPHRPPCNARSSSGRSPLPGPPGCGRQGHGHHLAGPGCNLPRPCRGRDIPERKPGPPSGRGRNHQGLAQRRASTRTGGRAHHPSPGPDPGDRPATQARPWGKHRIAGDGAGQRRRRPGHRRRDVRRRTEALRSRSTDVGRHSVLGRRNRPHHHPEGQELARASNSGSDPGNRPRAAGNSAA